MNGGAQVLTADAVWCGTAGSAIADGDVVPHRNYAGGLETTVIPGIPTGDVLIGATSRAAAALGLDGVTGVLSPGFSADPIVVGGDPLADVSAVRDLLLVMARGEEFAVDPQQIDAPDPAYAAALAALSAETGRPGKVLS